MSTAVDEKTTDERRALEALRAAPESVRAECRTRVAAMLLEQQAKTRQRREEIGSSAADPSWMARAGDRLDMAARWKDLFAREVAVAWFQGLPAEAVEMWGEGRE